MRTIVLLLALTAVARPEPAWRPVVPGAQYATLTWPQKPDVGDGVLHVVRIDPAKAKLFLGLGAARERKLATTAEWCASERLAVATNAGMFAVADVSSHTGYTRHLGEVRTKAWVKSYKSVLVMDPVSKKGPRATILDVEDGGPDQALLAPWTTVVQNLRLISSERGNTWSQQQKRWSEAALALDREGRLLILFSRSPLSMHDFNARILALPLGIVRAQHLEGGPVASLSIHAPGIDVDLVGSYETGVETDDLNGVMWKIPNVFGVALP